MFREGDPSISRNEIESSPEEELIRENPELAQVSMIEGAASLIREGDEANDSEKINKGLEVLELTKEAILEPNSADSERASRLKKVAGEVFGNIAQEHGTKKTIEDLNLFYQEIKNAKSGERLKTFLNASIELSKKQGILHLWEDIKRGLSRNK